MNDELDFELERLRALVVETANDLGDARHERDQLEILLSKVEADAAALRVALLRCYDAWKPPVPDWLIEAATGQLGAALLAELMKKQNDLDAYRQAAAALRVAYDQYVVCAEEFGEVGALDACGDKQRALDEAILAVLAIE